MKPRFLNTHHFKNFWKETTGKELLEWADITPQENTFNKYAPLYHQTDELADAAVRDTYLKLNYHDASALIKKYAAHPITGTEEIPVSLRNLLLQMQQFPDWFDHNLANKGAALCMRAGVSSLIILRDYTLMPGYDFAYLNKPLIFTEALRKGAPKRLKYTLEFWVNATRENALQPHTDAYQLILRTRLMHSFSRLQILQKSEKWDFENWGEPINFWDMIATSTGFSLIYLHGLKKLGIQISEEEELGLYHLWKYVGYLLGIPVEYIPNNRQEAVDQFYWWTSIQDKSDQDSVHLAKALLLENVENTIYKFQFQRKILMHLHESMNWFLLSPAVLERLQIPNPGFPYRLFPKFVVKANRISQKFYLKSPNRYRKLVKLGNKQQQQVLADYIKHTPTD